MKPVINIVGKRFGRWIVFAELPQRQRQKAVLWQCRCDCGTERPVIGHSLRSGKSISCGCAHREQLVKRQLKHGHARRRHTSRTFSCWQHMLRRCCNQRCKDYPHYGSRGITVCARWSEFTNFLLDMGEPLPGASIDRIDPNGNYEPGNCRWATRAQQTANRRPFKQLGLRGEQASRAKLSAADVAQIRALSGAQSQEQIAQRFGISQSNVSHILTGKTWNAGQVGPARSPDQLENMEANYE